MITEIEIGKVYKSTSNYYRTPRCIHEGYVFYSCGETRECKDDVGYSTVEFFKEHHEPAPKEIVKKEIEICIYEKMDTTGSIGSCYYFSVLNKEILKGKAKLIYEVEE